jgi:hypothetical protein
MDKITDTKLNKKTQGYRKLTKTCEQCLHKRYVLDKYKRRQAACWIGGFTIAVAELYTCNNFEEKPKTIKKL